MQEKMIEIENLVFDYPAQTEEEEPTRALDGIQLTVDSGEFVAILGHNGSGKSTLAKLLNAQYLPTEGDIRILGMNTKEEENLWNIRKNCGMVFQNPDNQMVATIVEEDVAFGPENLGVPNPELRERVDAALKAVNMYEYRMKAPHQLSGGQKQRVAIAGVLAMHPNCLVMDEPTAMLDPMGRKDIMDTILYLRNVQKKTILLITHYMEEAALADRVLVMNEGKIALEGTPREVFRQVDRMRALSLDVPPVTELAYKMHHAGFDIPEDILTPEEFLEAL